MNDNHKSFEEGKKFQDVWETVERDSGVYVPFAKVVEEMGFACDPEGAIGRATAYLRSCIEMGGQWLSYNSMYKEMEIYLLRREHSQEMSKKWTLYQQSMTRGESKASSSTSTSSIARKPAGLSSTITPHTGSPPGKASNHGNGDFWHASSDENVCR